MRVLKNLLRDGAVPEFELSEYLVAAVLIALAVAGALQLSPFYISFGTGVIIAKVVALITVAIFAVYYDVRHARIPNIIVCTTLVAGVVVRISEEGGAGALSSVKGCAFAFLLSFALYMLAPMGVGEVKFFTAIGALVGPALVVPVFLTVIFVGACIALVRILRAPPQYVSAPILLLTMRASTLSRWAEERTSELPCLDRFINKELEIHYGAAIAMGSLIAVIAFNIFTVPTF